MKWLRRLAVYALLRLATILGRMLPWEFGGRLFAVGGRMAAMVLPDARRRTLENLETAFGNEKPPAEISAIARDCFAHLGRTLFEVIKLPILTAAAREALVDVSGEEHVREALSAGRGMIFVGGHIGNWELMAAIFAGRGYPLHVVAAPSYDPRLDALMARTRRCYGIKTIIRGAGSQTARSILACLKKKEILVLLLDQDTRDVDGVFVSFFDSQAYTPAAAAVLALGHSVPAVIGSIWREAGGRHHIAFDPPVFAEGRTDDPAAIRRVTQLLTTHLETAIRRHPEQWVWMHNRWKRKPPDKKPAPAGPAQPHANASSG